MRSKESALSTDEVLLLVGLALVAVALGIVDVGGIRDSVVHWMVLHRILAIVPGAVIPLTSQIGIAGPGAALVASTAVLAVLVLIRRRRRPPKAE